MMWIPSHMMWIPYHMMCKPYHMMYIPYDIYGYTHLAGYTHALSIHILQNNFIFIISHEENN